MELKPRCGAKVMAQNVSNVGAHARPTTSNPTRWPGPAVTERGGRVVVTKWMRAELVGLVGAAHLNGRHGVVGAWDDVSDRFAVLLDGDVKPIAVRPANLVATHLPVYDTVVTIAGGGTGSMVRSFIEFAKRIASKK